MRTYERTVGWGLLWRYSASKSNTWALDFCTYLVKLLKGFFVSKFLIKIVRGRRTGAGVRGTRTGKGVISGLRDRSRETGRVIRGVRGRRTVTGVLRVDRDLYIICRLANRTNRQGAQ